MGGPRRWSSGAAQGPVLFEKIQQNLPNRSFQVPVRGCCKNRPREPRRPEGIQKKADLALPHAREDHDAGKSLRRHRLFRTRRFQGLPERLAQHAFCAKGHPVRLDPGLSQQRPHLLRLRNEKTAQKNGRRTRDTPVSIAQFPKSVFGHFWSPRPKILPSPHTPLGRRQIADYHVWALKSRESPNRPQPSPHPPPRTIRSGYQERSGRSSRGRRKRNRNPNRVRRAPMCALPSQRSAGQVKNVAELSKGVKWGLKVGSSTREISSGSHPAER